MAHTFLSDEWFDAVMALKDQHAPDTISAEFSIVMNQVISEVPFGTGRLEISVDTTSGAPHIVRGHRERADVTVRTDYATAKSVLIDQDPQAVMQAFMSGRILVEGDIAKLMTIQASAMGAVEQHPDRAEIAKKLKDLTLD